MAAVVAVVVRAPRVAATPFLDHHRVRVMITTTTVSTTAMTFSIYHLQQRITMIVRKVRIMKA